MLAACLMLAATGICRGAGHAEGYAPIYLMYAGEPDADRLQGLRQFLISLDASPRVSAETLDSVRAKLRRFKAGFAHPIFMSEEGLGGNACVVADSHFSQDQSALDLLASASVQRTVLGRGPALERQAVLTNVLNHEMFHCYDLMAQTQVEIGTRIAQHGAAYFAYWSEVGADAYAALKYLRNGGNRQLIRIIRDFRTLNLLNGDAAHYTANTLDDILWRYDQQRLQRYNQRQLVQLAQDIRARTVLAPEEFGTLEQVAETFERDLKRQIGIDVLAGPAWLHPLDYRSPDPETFSQYILQIRAALYHLGGEVGQDNAYFQPLMRKYYRPLQFRIRQAGAAHAGDG